MDKDRIFLINSFLYALIFSCIILVSTACSSQTGNGGLDLDSKNVLARINGEDIYEGDVFKRIQAAYGQIEKDKIPPTKWQMILEAAIDSEIADRLLLKAALEEKLEVSDEKIELILSKSREMLGEEGFKKMLKDNSSTEEDYKNFIRKNELINLYKEKLYKNIYIDDDTIKKYYDGHKEKLFTPEKVLLEVITVNDKDLADEIYEKYFLGESIEKLSEVYSKNNKKFSAKKLRLMPIEAVPVDIQPLIKSAKEGEIIKPFLRNNEYYIIKVKTKEEKKRLSFEDAKEEIRTILLNQKKEAILEEWLNKKRQEVKIEYLR